MIQRVRREVGAGGSYSLGFRGRSASGRVLAAGSYSVRLTTTDLAGNVGVTSKRLVISSKRKVTKTWKRSFSAKAAAVYQSVGKCSTLRSPASRGWSGSFGFYSQTKCKRANDSAVLTQSGVYVPKAFQNKYGKLQISMYGGAATVKRNSYIVLGYLRASDGAFMARSQFGGTVGTHAGRSTSASPFVFEKTARPFVLWTTGLTQGSRYDVKSYTVKLTYTALQ